MKESVLITGSSSGIGQACAHRLARAGMTVIGGARRYIGANDRIEESPDITCLGLDIGDSSSIDAFVDTGIAAKDSQLSYAVLNAGLCLPDGLLAGSVADHEKVMSGNFSGHLQLLRALDRRDLLRTMKAIVFIGSIYGRRASPQVISYAASKAAVESLTQSLALELAPATRVNCVLPGHIDTPMLAAAGPAFVEDVLRRTPLQRIGTAEEIAQLVEYLLTSATFMTGTAIVADGGYQLT